MKKLIIKEWFLNKKAEEFSRNLEHEEAFAILKETEKAYYIMYSLAPNYPTCFWVPKSVTEFVQTDKEDHETKFIEDYDKAVVEFKSMWSSYI